MAFSGYCAWCGRNTQWSIVGRCGWCGRRNDAPEPSIVVCQLDGRVYDEANGGCPDCWERREAERYAERPPPEHGPAEAEEDR